MPREFDFRGWGRKSGKAEGLSGQGVSVPGTDGHSADNIPQFSPSLEREPESLWLPVEDYQGLAGNPDSDGGADGTISGLPNKQNKHHFAVGHPAKGASGSVGFYLDDDHSLSARDNEAYTATDRPFLPDSLDPHSELTTISHLRIRASLVAERLQGMFIQSLSMEQAAGTPFLLFTVLVGLGAAGYFVLPSEPQPVILVLTLVVVMTLAIRQQVHGPFKLVLAASLAILAGATLAQVRSQLVLGPSLQGQVTGKLTGEVVSVERRANGSVRYLVRPTTLEGVVPADLPDKVRVSGRRDNANIRAGGGITGLARLQAYSGPLYPGGYDFGFLPRYSGIGATGFFMGAPAPHDLPRNGVASKPVSLWLAKARRVIGERIGTVLPDQTGAIANALITGERAGLTKETQESLRKSGLAHILAISGLHMALVTLTFIWFLRGLWSFFPSFSQNRPVRKYAAIGGIIVATAYLMLSGNSVASQRAWIMIMVMLVSVLFDRKALTMRSVAVAALLIIAISPESVFSAGFQMSFAAVAALVAAYGAWSRYRFSRDTWQVGRHAGVRGGIGRLLGYFSGLGATSIIAGGATALLAAYHFQRIAVLGLFSNLLAMPLVSIVVMPSALISMIAMPYGLESAFLPVMGLGIDAVLRAADFVNSFQSDRITGLLPPVFLALGLSGLGMLVVFTSRLRLLGILPLGLSLFIVKPMPPPDIIIAENGRAIAVLLEGSDIQGGTGPDLGASTSQLDRNIDEKSLDVPDAQSDRYMAKLVYLYPRRSSFVRENWEKAWPDQFVSDPFANAETAKSIRSCDSERCVVDLGTRGEFHLVYDPDLLADSCAKADILVAPRLKWVRCRGERQPHTILKREDFENRGTHALTHQANAVKLPQQPKANEGSSSTRDASAWTIRTALQNHGRPWQRQAVTYQDNRFD